MEMVSLIANCDNLTKYEKLYIAMCPEDIRNQFIKKRAEMIANRKPEKMGYLTQTAELEDWEKVVELMETKRLEANE
ncbi:hypothetical protein [Methanococcus voltae]|uniref:hypothetical protein n=1 Tax=Methanococcus voltae TaxID=2188 RepID=UPI001AE3A791|nr:hypothetical protein [Methanococcus voltae]